MRLAKSVFILALFASVAWAGWVTQESGTAQDLNANYVLSASTAFAVGNTGTILRTTSGGASWEVRASGTLQNLNDIAAVSSLEIYAAGSSGTLLKSIDNGDTWTPLAVPAEIGTANLVKIAFNGAVREVAADNGYLLHSGDSGASWSLNSQEGLNLAGVYVSGGGNTYVWGQSATDATQYQVRRDGVTVETTTTPIKDLVMASTLEGYLVGNSGQFNRTNDGGLHWADTVSGLSANINSLAFIGARFGWIVGDAGTVGLTSDGGDSWTMYTLTPSANISDIAIKNEGTSGNVAVHAYLTGAGGRIYKLESPSLTGLSPTSKKAGWIGTVEVTGSGFISGAYISFEGSGMNGISVLSTTYQSDSSLVSYIIITPEATLGAWDVMVTNGDATVSTEAGAFTVAANSSDVVIPKVWFGSGDARHICKPPTLETSTGTLVPQSTITKNVVVTIEAESPSGMARIARIVALVEGVRYKYDIPAANINLTTLPISAEACYLLTLPAAAAGKNIPLTIYAEDLNGNTSQKFLYVAVATTSEAIPPTIIPVTGAGPGAVGLTGIAAHTWDPETTATMEAFIKLPIGLSVTKLKAIMVDFHGNNVWQWEETYDPPATGQIDLIMEKAKMATYLSAGLYLLVVSDDKGRLIAKNVIPIVPSSL
jgi:photosystem II stability/assembly factor-like uncharacterized protein